MPKIRTLKPRLTERTAHSLATWSDDRRIRGTTLQNIRRAHFQRFPLCVHCLVEVPERTTLATELDHIVPLHLGGVDSVDPFENRQGLCAEHHLNKTNSELSAHFPNSLNNKKIYGGGR